MKEKLFQEVYRYGIIPVVKIDDVKDAIPLAQALIEGGLPVAEVTYRTDCAEEAIREINEKFPQMLLIAGTVLTIEQVDSAISAGAKMIVSPGLNPKIVQYCNELGVPIVPGVSSPSDIEMALELGLNVVKFFPAEINGGIQAIKAMSAPYGNIRFMPTGGINENNLKDYLAFNKIIACGGTWMVKSDLIINKDFDQIKNLTKQAVSKMLNLELGHVGISDEGNYEENVTKFTKLFMTSAQATDKSVFVNDIELIKSDKNKNHGHLGIKCSNVERAKFHLESQGFKFDEDSATNNNDDLSSIYFKDMIAGLNIKLCRK